MRTASVISYCSYHNAFIDRTIAEAKKVSDEVVVVSFNKFFDGTPDDDLEELDVDMHLILPIDPTQPARYHHNLGRQLGYKELRGEYDAVFFIDADEVLEGYRVKEWLRSLDPVSYGGVNKAGSVVIHRWGDHKLSHFWYYRDTCYRAEQVEEGAVLVSTQTLESPEMDWFGAYERENFSTHWNRMASFNNKVLGHHYSWAGSKEMIVRKIASWGHNQDLTDWHTMVEEEYSHEFNYKCPFKPYTFTKVEPYIGFTFDE